MAKLDSIYINLAVFAYYALACENLYQMVEAVCLQHSDYKYTKLWTQAALFLLVHLYLSLAL